MNLTSLLVFSLAGSVGAVLGGGILLALPGVHLRLRNVLLGFSTGTLLGVTFTELLPAAFERADPKAVLLVTLLGFLSFFTIEKIFQIPHSHGDDEGFAPHDGPKGGVRRIRRSGVRLVLIGDTFHNFVDGVLLAAAFAGSEPLGIVTAIAIIAHEIPQEIGDFTILLEEFSKKKAYLLNILSATATLWGALLTYAFRSQIEPLVPYFLAFSASSFLYVSVVDLVPTLYLGRGFREGLKQSVAVLSGVLVILLLHEGLH